MTRTIVMLDMTPPARVEQMRALLPDGFTFHAGTERGEAHMKAIIAGADYAIAGQVGVSAEVLAAGTRLKMLHKWGVGLDNIDVGAAKTLGIHVARTTGSNALSVAEFTLGLMLSALRHIPQSHGLMQRGLWRGPSLLPVPPTLLSGKTVAIVGLGAIGSAVAKLLSGFSCTLLYSKQTRLTPQEEEARGLAYASIGEMLERADVLSLHCPLTPQTANLIDAAALRRMKRSAVLVNVARGGVVDEQALVEALKERVIAAAAMDVFSVEPLPDDSPLRGLDNLILTPHLAASTVDIFEPVVRRMFDNFARHARGEAIREGDLVV